MPSLLTVLLPLLAWLGEHPAPVPISVAPDPAWVKQVGSQTRPAATAVFPVTKYEAVADGQILNTQAIPRAIDVAAKKDGVVTFVPGQYLTGFLKQGVTLNLPKGVTLLGSQELKDCPEMPSRVGGVERVWPAGLLNILGQDNVAITGEGTVDGQGKPFWAKYWAMRKEYDAKGLRWIVDYDAKRPRTLIVANSTDVTLQGITLQRAGFWTVPILYSQNVTADGLVIRNNVGGHGPSTDGIDINSSSYVLVPNHDIDCNDDNFCLKAGRDWGGLRVNRPTEYILIQNCVAGAGDGLFTCGSETSGGIRHVIARGLKAKGTKYGIRLKSATSCGGTVEDIVLENNEMYAVRVLIIMTMNWNPAYSYSALPEHWKKMLAQVEPARGTPPFRNVCISNLRATGAREAISAEGLPNSMLENFTLENITLTGAKAGKIDYARGWCIKGLNIKADDQEPVAVLHSADRKF